MKSIDVYGIGNALVDILIRIDESQFQQLDLEKATMRLADQEFQRALLEKFRDHKPVLASGGSVANSIITVAQLGGKSSFGCCIGDDKYGLFYRNEFEDFGIELPNSPLVDRMTGTSLIIITPDAERTMRTCLAVSTEFSKSEIDEEVVRKAKWLFVEGYLLSNPNNGPGAVRHAVATAKKYDTKIAFTCSDGWVVDAFRDDVQYVLQNADLVFANEAEASALTGRSDFYESLKGLKEMVPNYAVTAGSRGAWVYFGGTEAQAHAFPCTPVDLTGAGDSFAGAFLYGVTHGFSAHEAATSGCFLASKVISQVGARLRSGVKELWGEGLATC